MKKLILLLAFVGCYGMVNAQWTDTGSDIWTNDRVGIGTSTPASVLDIQNSGYTGFFIKETSGSGAAQFRFRANVGAFIFDNTAGALQAQIGFNNSSKNMFVRNQVNGDIFLETGNGAHVMKFTADGKLGVNTAAPSETLSVNGKMECEEAQVKTNVADYVFHDDYEMFTLEELESYISQNGHLPNIQTQEDVDNNRGRVKLGELSVSLMEKVEELTLHLIEMDKRVKALEEENKRLKERMK